MPAYKTPGVYVEEISTLPPSVAEVSTAIPAFFGYTEKGPLVARVSTLLDFEETFGGPHPATFTITTSGDTVGEVARDDEGTQFLLYYAVSHYFKNGGGACYIVSVGNYEDTPAPEDFTAGLNAIEKEDEPTLLVLTDAVNLDAADYHSLCQDALAQCRKLGDRFAIFDVQMAEGESEDSLGSDVSAFRQAIGTSNLMYGAAYYPYLQTSLSYDYAESGVTLLPPPPWSKEIAANTIKVTFSGSVGSTPTTQIVATADATTPTFAIDNRSITITVKEGATTGTAVVDAWNTWKADSAHDPKEFNLTVAGTGTAFLAAGNVDLVPGNTLAAIKSTNTALYNQIKARLAAERIILPPSAAVAGIYASVDRSRGVWKAPANVSIASVIGPVTKITNDDQDNLNVDPTAGKSINAIRAFTGKGTLVWGSRTLAGNDNEWRYIPVRRLFILIEESTQKATSFAVFEPNDMTTWLKVKGMIESFLYGLWERGALAGSAPDAAYYVNVGLGKTMTAQDILEGRMNVEIGIAASRPAEFIVIRFSHKLQEA